MQTFLRYTVVPSFSMLRGYGSSLSRQRCLFWDLLVCCSTNTSYQHLHLLPGAFIAVLALRHAPGILEPVAVYMSVLTNVIVSPALIWCLWREKRHADSLMGNSRIGGAHLQYGKVIRTLAESALPPLALGLIHILLFTACHVLSPLFNIFWITTTVGPCAS
jgi:hypothetical protein